MKNFLLSSACFFRGHQDKAFDETEHFFYTKCDFCHRIQRTIKPSQAMMFMQKDLPRMQQKLQEALNMRSPYADMLE